jgi:N-acetylglucosamine-6-sulfatase
LKSPPGLLTLLAVRPGVRLLSFGCVLLVVLAGAGKAAAQQPNIVLILTDDQRWDTVSYMPTVQSRLVEKGVTFANGFVTNPLCCPSRASILTGSYSHRTRVYRNRDLFGGFGSFRDESTVATWLDAAGYDTALIGKYLNRYPGSYVPPGWDRWVALQPPGYYRYGFDIDGEDFPLADRARYSTDFLAREAVSFISTATSPFFLYFAPYGPHPPATPAGRHSSAFADLPRWRPPSYNEREIADKPRWVRAVPRWNAARSQSIDNLRRKQLQSLLAVDEAVASILQALGHRGALANTLIVFLSDNGFLWGEHRLWGKWYPYEESVRVPFVVRYDTLISSARTETGAALGIDLAPTFAEVAGVAAPGSEGRSLLSILGSNDVAWRTSFLIESLNRDAPTYCAVRSSRHSFITYRTGVREIYDLAVDPYQLRNLAATANGRTIVKRLVQPLARLCNPPPPGFDRRLLCTKSGTSTADTLVGTARYDIMCGRDGADRIRAGAGSDYIFPGKGRDAVWGGAGRDHVLSREGNRDRITCGSGLDIVRADRIDVVAPDCEEVRRS